MNCQPVNERELRRAARGSTLYWLRAGVAMAAISFTFWMTQMNFFPGMPGGFRKAGTLFFQNLGLLAYLSCLVAGVVATADCLAREKREGTLGLLFLTRLKSMDIILGKMAANSVNMLFSLLALLPCLIVPVLFGGVTLGDYVRLVLVLVSLVWLSLAAGMFFSAISFLQQRAMMATFLYMFIVGGMASFLPEPLNIVSPYTAFSLVPEVPYSRAQEIYFLGLFVMHAQAWILLGLADWIVMRCWRADWRNNTKGEAPQKAVAIDHPELPMEDNIDIVRMSGGVHWSMQKAMLDANPVEWLSSGRKRGMIWLSLVLGAPLCLAGGVIGLGNIVAVLPGLHFILKVWMAWEASRRFTEDRRLGMLELIAVTPLTSTTILAGQFKSLVNQFLGPVMAVFAADMITLMTVFQTGGRDSFASLVAIVIMIVFLLLDLVALAMMGMWLGLKTGRQTWSTIRCLLVIQGIPAVLLWALASFLSMISIPHSAVWGISLAAWGLGSFFISLVAWGYAYHQLNDHFRLLVSEVKR